MHQHFKRLVPKGEYKADHSLHWKMLIHFHDAPKLVKLLRINKQYELNKKLNQISVNKATKNEVHPLFLQTYSTTNAYLNLNKRAKN